MTNQLKKVRNINEFMDKNSLDNALVVAKNCYMNKITKWSTQENKLALIVISKIKTINQKGLICIYANDIKQKLGIKNNYELRRLSKKMLENSFFEFEDSDGFKDGYLMYKQELSYTSGYLYIGIDSDYLPLFQNLSSNFTMIPLDALISYTSKYSIILTQFINKNYDLKNLQEETMFGNREQLWGLFGLDDNQFLIKSKPSQTNPDNVEFLYTEDGKRVRNIGYKPPKEPSKIYRWPDFENRILKRAIDEINKVSNILGYSLSYSKKIAKSDIGHYVDGYYITIKKGEKEISNNIIDIDSSVKQSENNEETVFDQLKKQKLVLLKSKKVSDSIKQKIKNLTEEDIKIIGNNLIENGNEPNVPNKYFQRCILNYLIRSQRVESQEYKDKLPAYMTEKIELDQTSKKTREELSDEIKDLIKSLDKKGE